MSLKTLLFVLCLQRLSFHVKQEWEGEWEVLGGQTESRQNLELKLVLQAEWKNETCTDIFIYFHYHD